MNYIIGSSGQVGTILSHYSPTAIHYQYRLENDRELRGFLDNLKYFDTVYLTAALTAVDFCERHPLQSKLINLLPIKTITDCVKKAHATLVFYSTDYVFDGVNALRSVDDIPNPINVYGVHKLAAEHYIQSQLEKYHIVRTNMVFGHDPNRKNFNSQLVDCLAKGSEFTISTDEMVTPTYNKFLVDQTLQLGDNYGIHHIVGEEFVSRFYFALMLCKAYGLNEKLIVPTKSWKLGRAAKRPLSSGLNPTASCGKLQDAIKDMLQGK